ncbi:hypothetical protein NQ318_014857 [Aromia moschata]|uniref:Uncharacterized protein n=1 Tax=Aromia moschata TaxID=1265417 RepID=A0AAV8XBL4_9CUCU|nr:hypothetical protein NQ318_014857 [Aromia moschata]
MKAYFLLLLFVLPAVILMFNNGNSLLAYGEEDPLEDEAEVEGESDAEAEVEVSGVDEEDDEITTTSSPDADTTLLFVKPVSTGASQLAQASPTPVLLPLRPSAGQVLAPSCGTIEPRDGKDSSLQWQSQLTVQ